MLKCLGKLREDVGRTQMMGSGWSEGWGRYSQSEEKSMKGFRQHRVSLTQATGRKATWLWFRVYIIEEEDDKEKVSLTRI